jgi:hypothetical protein
MRRTAHLDFTIGLLLGVMALGCGLSEDTVPTMEPGEAVRQALAEPDQLVRVAILLPVLERLDPQNLDEVLAAYEQSFGTGAERGAALILLMEAWVDFDSAGAFDRIMGWPIETRVEAVAALLRPWARSDPVAASRAYNGLQKKRLYTRAFSSLVVGWAESGESEIWTLVEGLEPGLERENASRHVMEAVLRREGPQALFRQVEELPPGAADRFKVAAFRTAGALVAGIDPAAATAFVAKHLGGPYDRMLVARVGQRWAIDDGDAAMAWIQTLEPGEERDAGMRETYRRWLIRQPDLARAWMRERADDTRVAPILKTYAVVAADDDPIEAVEWAQGISDPELRTQALIAIGERWLPRDPERAKSRLEELGVYDAILEAERARAEKFKGHRRPRQAGPDA